MIFKKLLIISLLTVSLTTMHNDVSAMDRTAPQVTSYDYSRTVLLAHKTTYAALVALMETWNMSTCPTDNRAPDGTAAKKSSVSLSREELIQTITAQLPQKVTTQAELQGITGYLNANQETSCCNEESCHNNGPCCYCLFCLCCCGFRH